MSSSDRTSADFSRRSVLRAAAATAIAGLGACTVIDPELPPLATPKATDYLLGAGDQVRVVTFGEQQLSGDFRVDTRGNISMPLIGRIRAGGSAPTQLEGTIARALTKSELYKDPSVTVEVIAYRPVFILGEVNKPGQYPFQPGMTVVTAVAIAGGYTYRAVKDKYSIVRTDADGKTAEGSASRESLVTPGDVLTVRERFF